eukprot:Clim_evm8s91 gene=Clim_evmTU8s91
MNFKVVALAAGVAVASAGSSTAPNPANLPEVIRQAIASDPAMFPSEAARQEFIEGDGDDYKKLGFYIRPDHFNNGDCTAPRVAKSIKLSCVPFKLEGENKEVVIVHDDITLGGTLNFGEQTRTLNYKKANLPNMWQWGLGTLEVNGTETFSYEIGLEDADPAIAVTNTWTEPLFGMNGLFYADNLIFYWYRSPTIGTLEDDVHLWWGAFTEPKC